jgi:KDO2-lipid IV(A) lauroyltransferase
LPHPVPPASASPLPPRPAADAPSESAAGDAPPADRAPTLAHRLEFAALRAAVGGLGALSWERATAVGARLGRAGYAPLGIRRGVVERQIAAAFPEFDEARVREVARASYESLGRTTIEAALVPRLGREGVLSLFARVDGWELLEEALAARRGALVVTGHLGNWELGGSYVAARGVGIDGVARQMANPLFDAFLTNTRQRLGMTVVWDGHAVRRTPRSLRENRVVAMVSDQGALGLASTWVPFFGRPAKTPRGPAVFALRLRVPILFAAAVRLPDGRFRLGFERVPVEESGDRERDVDAIVAAYTRVLEEWVRRYPEQYFWQHRRWKHQPPDTPAHLREP